MSQEGTPIATEPPGQPVSLVSKKKRIRGGYRAHTKKLFGDCKTLLEKEHPESTLIEGLSRNLNDKLKLLRAVDEEIFLLLNDDEIEAAVIDAEEWQAEIQARLVALDAAKSPRAAIQQASASASADQMPASNQNSIANAQAANQIANLPKLTLPKYSGDPKRWHEFWDAFGVIHDNCAISPVNKFRHLRTLLEGKAAAAISGIQTTDANYKMAVDLLKDRFAQKQIIVNSHIEALMSLNTVTTDKDVKGLRILVDKIDTNVRSLETLGYDLKEYGPFLNPMIVNKLPDEVRLAITKQVKDEEWELEKILKLIEADLNAREQCAQMNTRGNNTARPNRNPVPTTAALLNNESKVTCSFCKGHHLSAKCTIVTDPGRRKQMLLKQGQCFVCLKKGHRSKECKSNIFVLYANKGTTKPFVILPGQPRVKIDRK